MSQKINMVEFSTATENRLLSIQNMQ